MVLYIDKENLISLVQSKDKGTFWEYTTLVKRNLDIYYNFSKEEIKGNKDLEFWFSQFGSGVGGQNHFCPPKHVVPTRPMRPDFYASKNAPDRSAIFFLSDKRACEEIGAKRCVLLSKVGDELSTLKEVFQLKDRGEVLNYKIKKWSDFLPQLPLSDIIICDNYYFSTAYKKDNNEIIRTLSAIPHHTPVNVVIIIKPKEGVAPGINLEKEQEIIKRIVVAATGCNRSTVTILATTRVHDRALITNYYRVKSGCGFHLNDSGIKHDVLTEVKTHAIRNNHNTTKDLLKEYQEDITPNVKCYGDKVSNFLTFK